ncbi:MAG: malonyl CoA-acyl carrier protein transacylase, partial [Myxococcaceae bacterium]|nr:malonyl CoA-acyl carrier protein transacylase [Myxococcaceae bacterium]
GVYVGQLWQDFRLVGAEQGDDQAAVIAAVGSELANRISHVFSLTGPSVAIDTSCSSSLTALHLAACAIRRGECDSAVVCGVSLVAHAYHARVLQGLGLVAERAPSGAYDQDSPGWAVGEGAGALLLRRTTSHGAAGDMVLAIVEATHAEHSGSRAPFGVPSIEAIESAVRATLADARITADAVDYVECAASGAAISDAAEWQALSQVFEAGVRVGTLKPSIGHLEAASGLSQISKALLQFEHGELAPTRLASNVSSLIDPRSGPLQIVVEPTPFGASARSRILVNAVGATGSSAQTILAAPPRVARRDERQVSARGPSVLLISAATNAQLVELAARYIESLVSSHQHRWVDVCATTQLGRESRRYRLALEVSDREQAIAALRSYVAGRPAPALRFAVADAGLSDCVSTSTEWKGAVHDWLSGRSVAWAKFWSGEPRRVRLPTYPFARQPYWTREPALQPVLTSSASADEERWLQLACDAYSRAAGIPRAEIDPRMALERYGLSSRIATEVAAQINRELAVSAVPATLLYEHRDLASVARAIASCAANHVQNIPAAAGPSVRLEGAQRATERGLNDAEPIAIIGLAGRYPGASDMHALWQRLCSGEDLVARRPAERSLGSALVHGGLLDDVESFDPFLFGITPADAARMDPQERLFLEVVWEALEDACFPPTRLKRELAGQVGVFVGVMHNEYPLLGRDLSTHEQPVDAGGTPAGIANRVSYHLDLSGPSLAVDTMCSSALVALQMAVDALRRGQVRLAIVGGTNLSLHANKFVQQERLGMTSSHGRCRSFGAGADGFVPGEGVGAIILCRLADAEQSNARIHALVRGAAVNHGGKVNGFTVPNPEAQTRVVLAALKDAGVSAETVSYVEAHGTGTALGDPLELRALSAALGLNAGTPVLTVGSVKSNMGHLEAAAGIAGITKVLLQMRHKTIAPSLHCAKPNPDIDWRFLRVAHEAEPWAPRRELGREVWRAGVSSFGAGGVNAHVLLEAYEEPTLTQTDVVGAQLLVLSAATSDALSLAADRLAAWCAAAELSQVRLADVAATLQTGREALKERWACVSRDLPDFVQQLRAFAREGQAGCRGRARLGEPPVVAGTDLHSTAARWVLGADVDWEAMHAGPRRKLTLPTYSFTRMRCWVDDVLPVSTASKRALSAPPARLENQRLAPATARGLAERVWRPAVVAIGGEHDADTASSASLVLVLVTPETEPLGRELVSRLGPSRARILEGARLPGRELAADSIALVLLTDLDPTLARQHWQPAFEVCRTLARASAAVPLHILQVVSGLHSPSTNGSGSAEPMLAALVHGLAAERSGTNSTVLDVGAVDLQDELRCAACVREILDELRRRTPGDVCVTPFGRLVPSWQPVLTQRAAWRPRPDALYLVTGGTRGIGLRLATELVARGARRLALVGRTQSTACDQRVARISEAGASVVEVYYGSVQHRDALDAWLQGLERRHGPLAGIFHCAGVASARGGSLLDVDLDDLATVAAPKLDGLAALLPAIERAQPEVVVAFSSISAALPAMGVGVGDYAAANNAM